MRDLNPDPVRSIPLYKVRGRFLFFQIFTHCDTKMQKTQHTHRRRECGVLESLHPEHRLFSSTPSCALVVARAASCTCFQATQALISLITSFATSSIASALSLRNGRGKSSSETTALSPTRTSLPRGVVRWVSAGAR